MTMTRKFKPSPPALAILALLHEEPMHPYRMQRLIKERNKEQVINVGQRASLYQTIKQLLRAELIAYWEHERQEKFPERTLYRLTDKGHEVAVEWMRGILASPAQEFPEFPAAISLLPLLTPEDALKQLERRETALTEKLTALNREAQTAVPRLFLLETEWLRATLSAELDWLRGLLADLRAGTLTWDQTWMRPSLPPETHK